MGMRCVHYEYYGSVTRAISCELTSCGHLGCWDSLPLAEEAEEGRNCRAELVPLMLKLYICISHFSY